MADDRNEAINLFRSGLGREDVMVKLGLVGDGDERATRVWLLECEAEAAKQTDALGGRVMASIPDGRA